MSSDRASIQSHVPHDMDKRGEKVTMDMEHGPSKENGDVIDHGADTQLHRSLGTRHLTMVALGSAIGMGMWLGSGTILINGGPANMFIGFVISSSIVWAVCQSIGEMASSRWVCFGLGYWFSYWITIANELQGVVTVLGYWTNEVPTAALITIFWVVIILINVWVVRFFADVEVFSSTIKFSWMFVAIVALIVIAAGGSPQGEPIGFRYWNAQPFNNGVKGFLSVLPTCVFAMAGSENAALVATEVANPRRSMPKTIGSIWLRLGLFYILGSLSITLTVDPKDPSLFGGSGSDASPFVIAFKRAGLTALAHMTNAVILISIVSTGSISGYGGSRMLMGLAHVRMNHPIFGKADAMGRPWAGYIATIGIGGALAYLNVSQTGVQVFTWLSNLVSLLTLFGWGMICLSHLRFRYTWKLQGRDQTHIPWRTWAYPYATWWGLAWCIALIGLELYLSIWPLHEQPSAKTFFANYISVIAVVIIWVGAQIWYRCPLWVDASTIDLDQFRRFYAERADEESTPVRKSVVRKVKALFE
ncbi:arginine permease [Aspergillus homomorphus CBS 101889]|uniref:Arginine permease n=1 Tax=Aspergillus homomorphus (strain CBS 101889) TaxID=1450537 RepID=A0A395HKZ6_ASPHC|nr:arginine permease [Aspergillus homomorphus CBS 101889]RAL08266.1 arginine permease [Aspergillus homomorphus CBS 101889]